MARSSDETRDASQVASPATARADAPLLAIGDIVAARYRLVRFIARGGMGEVYEADDLELGNRIAIKTIRAERAGDPEAIVRLKREVLAARRVTHHNVVRLFDVGFHVLPDERELAFVTMELLAGETLDAMIRRRGRLAPDEALALARDMAAALDAAHAAGVVHRDFKSANVIVVDGRAIVTDFGLARASDVEPSGTTAVDFVGTPAYMAPEQVTHAHAIGPPADIYAFGVVLFEMITGAWPFRRDTALATAAARVEAEAPSPRIHVADVPVAWEAAIARCLERDQAKRFARASDVIAALTGRVRMSRRWLALAAGAAALIGGVAFVVARPSSACGDPDADVYVDSTAAAGGTGARACPVRTISDALATHPRTIHVAAGFYDKAHGERFPLVVRGEVAIVGAGVDQTTVSGVGTWRASDGGTGGTEPWQATIITGDRVARIELAGVTVTSGLQHATADSVGVACVRGGETANTFVHDVAIGGYGVDILAGTEERPTATACNLEVSDARLQDGVHGIWLVGCGQGGGRIPVGLRVRRTTFAGFHNDRDPVYPGSGVFVWDCVHHLEIDHSKFTDSDAGIDMVHHNPETLGPVTIHDNQLQLLSRQGIRFHLAVAADIRNNTFYEIAGSGENIGRAAALWLYSDGLSSANVVLRGNRFVENDHAIQAVSFGAAIPDLRLDAGRSDDPGRNTFACNAAPAASPNPGGDVAITAPLTGSSRVTLAGNIWDHVPPTRTPGNGVDLVAPDDVDTSGGVASTGNCPARGR